MIRNETGHLLKSVFDNVIFDGHFVLMLSKVFERNDIFSLKTSILILKNNFFMNKIHVSIRLIRLCKSSLGFDNVWLSRIETRRFQNDAKSVFYAVISYEQPLVIVIHIAYDCMQEMMIVCRR